MTGEVVATPKEPTRAEQAKDAMRDAGDLWHSGKGDKREGWLSFQVDDGVQKPHCEHWPIMSRTIDLLIRHTFYLKTGFSLKATEVKEVQRGLETRALFQGDHHEVHLRIGRADDALWIDLHDPEWRAVRVTAEGWVVVNDPPIMFRHVDGMEALPIPMKGGSVEDLRPFLNLSDDDWIMVKAFIVMAFRDTGPFPILEFCGQAGAAKSTSARLLSRLIDPSDNELLDAPKEYDFMRDVMLEVRERRLVVFDNLSKVSTTFSNILCGLSTGRGFSTRKLRTDLERVRLKAMLPVIVCGVPALAERSDLADRVILIRSKRLSKRKTERKLFREFDKARPFVLGAVLDAVSGALDRLPPPDAPEMEYPPRLADFAEWSVAAADDLGFTGAEFLTAYQKNRVASAMIALEPSPIANAIIDLAGPGWHGSPTALLALLGERCDTTRADYPGTFKALANELDRLHDLLLAVDVEVIRGHRTAQERLITIRRTPVRPDTPVTPVTPVTKKAA